MNGGFRSIFIDLISNLYTDAADVAFLKLPTYVSVTVY